MLGISFKKLIGVVLLLVGLMMLIELFTPFFMGLAGGDLIFTIAVAVILCIVGTMLSRSKTLSGKRGFKP